MVRPISNSTARQSEVLALRNRGLSYNEIAKKLGVTRNAIAGIIHRYNVRNGSTPKYPKVGSKTREAYLLYKSGVSYQDIAKQLDTSLNSVKVMICRAKRSENIPLQIQSDKRKKPQPRKRKLVGYAGNNSDSWVFIGEAAKNVVGGLR